MLNPTGGFFKKMFNPSNMKKKISTPGPAAPKPTIGARAPRTAMTGPLSKAVGRKAAY